MDLDVNDLIAGAFYTGIMLPEMVFGKHQSLLQKNFGIISLSSGSQPGRKRHLSPHYS
jgi:hypothetical protein